MRVRVAEDVVAEQLKVLAKLAFGVKPAAGVIQVDLAGGIQARVFAGAQVIQGARAGVSRVGVQKAGVGGIRRRRVGCGLSHSVVLAFLDGILGH